ncbi:lytic transglycosylase domain-containing protein [Agrobacterium rhizogenes]|uniref:hypothetical protein n=1 Tax=Rhizobium rhizogenes TaxID=359 RepID=UPI001574CF1B|nr:hypothetical protein [Rhizobium rhizogenes]NTF62090.1 lytic transglycosylase domain-containing protein [Rhizobium rhizogenes]
MARLPTVNPTRNILQADVSGPSPQALASPWQSISDAFGMIGTKIEQGEVADAAVAGGNATYRDADGNLKVDLRPNYSEQDRAYNRTAMAGFIARKQLDAGSGLQQIAQASNGDVAAYEKESSGYVKDAMRSVPDGLKGPVALQIEQERQQYFAGVSEQRRQRDVAVSKGNVLALKDQLSGDLGSLALNGGTNTPEYKAKQQQLNGLLGELANNRDFNYSTQQADIERQQIESRDIGYALTGQAQRSMEKGDTVGAMKLANQVQSDMNLHMKPEERYAFAGQIRSQVSAYQSVQREEVKPYIESAREMTKNFQQGFGFDSPDVDDTARQLRERGRPIEANQLLIARDHYAGKAAAESIPTNDLVRYASQGRGSAQQPSAPADTSTPTGQLFSGIEQKNGLPAGYLARTMQIESGGRNTGPNSAGAEGYFQFIPSTAARMGVNPRNLNSSADGAGRLAAESARYLRTGLGRDPTGAELYLAHQQGAGGAMKLLSNPDANAASLVGTKAIIQNGGREDMTAAQFVQMWANKYDGSSTTANAQQGNQADVPAWVQSPEGIKMARDAITQRYEQTYSDIESIFKSGTLPDKDTMHTMLEAIPQFTSPSLRQKYSDLLSSGQFAENLRQQYPNPNDRAAIVSDIQASFAADGASVAQFKNVEMYQASEKARQDALNNNAVGYAAQRYSTVVGQLPPLQATDSNAMASAMQVRDRAVGTLIDHGEIPAPVSAFAKSDMPTLTSIWRSADSSQLSALTSSMLSGLSPRTYAATLEDPKYQEMITGAALSNDPVRHQAAMQQLDALASHVGLGEVEHAYSSDIVNRLQDWQAHVRYSSDEEVANWLKSRNDPKWQERVQPLVTAAEKEARKVTPQQIATQISGNWVFSAAAPIDTDTQRMMQNDYVSLVGERNASLNDVGASQKQAIERMKEKWGASPALGGRMMLYPPENFYPALDGSHDWIGAQLQDFAKQRGIDPANAALIADTKTEGNISNRQPPGYLVARIDPATGFDNIVTDEAGRPLRVFFDPQEGQKQAFDAAIEKRKNDFATRIGNGQSGRASSLPAGERTPIVDSIGIEGKTEDFFNPVPVGIADGVGLKDIMPTSKPRRTRE